jgi:hypothetical protein
VKEAVAVHYTFAGLSIGLAALFAITGSAKLLRAPWTLAAARRLGCSENAFRAIGALEAAAVMGLLAGLLWGPLGIAAAVGLVALLVGAVIAHRRAGDPCTGRGPAGLAGPRRRGGRGDGCVVLVLTRRRRPHRPGRRAEAWPGRVPCT